MSTDQPEKAIVPEIPNDPSRRSFLSKILPIFMLGALAGAYGTFLSFAGRFLYPAKARRKEWLYVAELAKLKTGDSVTYASPTGEKISVAKQGTGSSVDDFIALSSTCPHLGCQVHWEGQNKRFFCPCHNGVFDPSGKATEGPPAEAKQDLPKYPLKVESGLLFIQVPVEKLATRTV